MVQNCYREETMLEVTRNGPNRLDLKLSGKLDAEQMAQGLDELESKSADIENGVMLYDVVDFNMPSLKAIGIELTRMPAMFGIIRKFKKAAVLTDKNWIKKAGEIEGLLIPWLEIKGFDREQRDEAEAWLAED